MIHFDVITIFPQAVEPYFKSSMLFAAEKKRLVEIRVHDLRKWGIGQHKKVDDRPYGGGPGMVFAIEPIVKALTALKPKNKNQKTKIILFSPRGKKFDAPRAREYAKKYERIVLIADHYEGFDARLPKIINAIFRTAPDILSIGDYVLTGGEIPAMAVVDAVARHIPGALGKKESLEEMRYGVGTPSYTRPEIFKYKKQKYRVPKVLLSGNNKKIDEWRKKIPHNTR